MKKIILILVVFLLTGCSASYNLDIDQSLNYTESFKVSDPNSSYVTSNELITAMQEQLDYEGLNNRYNLEVELVGKEATISGTDKSTNINELKDSAFITGLYRNITIKEGLINLSDYDNITLYNDNPVNPYLLEDIEIKINLPFRVTKHNAKRIDNNNTLYYSIKGDQYPDSIYIKYNPNKIYNKRYFTDIFEYIDVNLFITICLGVVIGLITLVIYLKKNKKTKIYRIDY